MIAPADSVNVKVAVEPGATEHAKFVAVIIAVQVRPADGAFVPIYDPPATGVPVVSTTYTAVTIAACGPMLRMYAVTVGPLASPLTESIEMFEAPVAWLFDVLPTKPTT